VAVCIYRYLDEAQEAFCFLHAWLAVGEQLYAVQAIRNSIKLASDTDTAFASSQLGYQCWGRLAMIWSWLATRYLSIERADGLQLRGVAFYAASAVTNELAMLKTWHVEHDGAL